MGQEGITRPGLFFLETLDSININDATMPLLNGTIDLASELVQSMDFDLGRVQMSSRGGGGGGGHASTSALEHIRKPHSSLSLPTVLPPLSSLSSPSNPHHPLNNRVVPQPCLQHKGPYWVPPGGPSCP